MITAGEKYRSGEPLPVICWWWYDTVAILEDYSDWCEATLPAGTVFTVVEIPPQAPTRILCTVENEKHLKELMIPKGRQVKSALCWPKGFHVEIAMELIEDKCEREMP